MMPIQRKEFYQPFFRIALALLYTLLLLRIFEYIAIASKSFTDHAYRYELLGLLYDVWLWLIYCAIVFFPLLLLARVKQKAADRLFHGLNILFIICYLALLITFSERNTPFDHELFTRNSKDTIDTVKQMLTGGMKPYIPFLIYLPVYFILYNGITKKITVPNSLLGLLVVLAALSVAFIKYANPSPDNFQQKAAYHLTSNKLSYWFNDTYQYFRLKNDGKIKKGIANEIAFYQQNQPFSFTSSDYPLMHENSETDVLGNFFNLQKTPPNIVIMVIEGLSRDFSGDHAYAGSFTPFLDSLSHKSLSWDNFLSTAPGTFAVHPAISEKEASLL
jgi:hypothetical protein